MSLRFENVLKMQTKNNILKNFSNFYRKGFPWHRCHEQPHRYIWGIVPCPSANNNVKRQWCKSFRYYFRKTGIILINFETPKKCRMITLKASKFRVLSSGLLSLCKQTQVSSARKFISQGWLPNIPVEFNKTKHIEKQKKKNKPGAFLLRYLSRLSQSSFVRQNIIPWSMLHCLIA